jgi:hypothetical protein
VGGVGMIPHSARVWWPDNSLRSQRGYLDCSELRSCDQTLDEKRQVRFPRIMVVYDDGEWLGFDQKQVGCWPWNPYLASEDGGWYLSSDGSPANRKQVEWFDQRAEWISRAYSETIIERFGRCSTCDSDHQWVGLADEMSADWYCPACRVIDEYVDDDQPSQRLLAYVRRFERHSKALPSHDLSGVLTVYRGATGVGTEHGLAWTTYLPVAQSYAGLGGAERGTSCVYAGEVEAADVFMELEFGQEIVVDPRLVNNVRVHSLR